MIKIEKLSHGYPQKDLYNDISFTIEPGNHCALIGVSGSGKSSLVDILMDPEEYMFTGTVEINHPVRMGFVSQFAKAELSSMTAFEFMAERHLKLQSEIDEICAKLETTEDMESTLAMYQKKLDEFDAIDGYDYEKNIKSKLNIAGLSHVLELTLTQISGGEFKLIQVIREMLLNPDLLIMDEPDVFLDFEHLNALKELINSHKKALLVITHSRFLLNHCFNKIIHLENTLIQEFEGSYIEYNFTLLAKKAEQKEQALKDDIEIERNEKLIERLRFRASYNSESSCGRALGSRVSHLKRLEEKRIHDPFLHLEQPTINLFTENPLPLTESGDEEIAIELTDFNVVFEETLLNDVNFNIGANDKIAIIGPNGAGKTTLLRSIFTEGTNGIKINDKVNMAYLSQNQGEILNEDSSIFDIFFDLDFPTYDSIKEFLEPFCFRGEILDQPIKTLSGGEKNILQLAIISSTKANMLLLDEPTSHLDTYSQVALEKAIKAYNGGVIMVSHDFYTIANCVDYVIIIEDKTARKMKLKKFKRNIYSKYFKKDYLQLEEQKVNLELRIEKLILDNQFEKTAQLLEELDGIITNMMVDA